VSDIHFIFLSLLFILALLASKILNEFVIYITARFSDCSIIIMVCTYVSFGVSCDNLDGIAIRYGMDVLGMKYRWRKKFPHLS